MEIKQDGGITNEKIFKTLVCLVLALQLVFINSVVVSADDSSFDQKVSTSIMSKSVSEVSDNVKEFLTNNDVTFTDDSTIELIKTYTNGRSSDYSTVICVTSSHNQETVKDVLIPLTINEEEGILKSDNTIANLLLQPRDGFGWDFNVTSGVILHATAVTNAYFSNTTWQTFYRPYAVMFSYRNTSSSSVSSITVNYNASGTPYTYPGFNLISMDNRDHSISLTKFNPSVSTRYAAEKEMSSGVCIETSSSNDFHILEYNVTINNKSYFNYIQFSPNAVYE